MSESHPASHILFDLDGTLVQTRVASWNVFRQVNEEFDLGIDDQEKYFALLNGNLFESVRQLCDTTEKADAAIKSFMHLLSTEYFPEMIPGMIDVVHALAPQSTLAVLSSNHTSVIRRVLTASGLEYCFAHVFGGDVEPDKTIGIRRFVADAAQGTGRQCSAFYNESAEKVGLADGQAVLVTDTIGDVEAALAAGIRAVGVSWGMHSEEQLRKAGAEFVAFWPQELVSYLRTDDSTGACAAPVQGFSNTNAADAGSLRLERRRQATAAAQVTLTLKPGSTSGSTSAAAGSCGCAGAPAPSTGDRGRLVFDNGSIHRQPAEISAEMLDAIRRTMR